MALIEYMLVLILASVALALSSDPCVVNFERNSASFGRLTSTFNNVSYCQYLGVRYAEAPIGKLRFMNPVLLHPGGSHNFTQFGSHCLQPLFLLTMIDTIGDEDCLFLNVFTPKLSSESMVKYPVLVFIHGGSFLIGSADKYVPGTPDLLVEQGIVIVTLNYRLGTLGFVQSKQFGIAGNMGLQDQLTALQWVQQYIVYFGGDPERVTLMGHSVGADSVTHSLYSNKFSGLYQQAIALGGSMLKKTFHNYDPEVCSKELLSRVNASSLEELQQLPVTNFLFGPPFEKLALRFINGRDPCTIPSLENSSFPDRMVAAPPAELVLTKPVNEVPLLMGQTAREYELHWTLKQVELIIGSNFPNSLNDSMADALNRLVEKVVIESNDHLPRWDVYAKFINIASRYFPIMHLLDQLVQQNYSQPIYYAQFDFDGRFGYTKYFTQPGDIEQDAYGPVHGDELGYIFTPHVVKEALENVIEFEREWKVHKQTVELLANFVKYGNPTPANLLPGNVIWPAYNEEPKYRLLHINETIGVGGDDSPNEAIYSLWKKVFSCLYYSNCDELHNEVNTHVGQN